MAVSVKKKKGGGKLIRSQTVSVRLDPKLRYLAELGSRIERRTLSSFVEWAVETYVNQLTIKDHANNMTEKKLVDLKEDLWDSEEIGRVIELGIHCPELLTFDEGVLWKIVNEEHFFWLDPEDFSKGVNYYNLRNSWDVIESYLDGEITRLQLSAKLPTSW